MIIKWLEFENLETELKVNRINFFDDITLLVGLSGVGKTVILNALDYSMALARSGNTRLHPYKVAMGFDIGGKAYQWFYTIEPVVSSEPLLDEETRYSFTYEKLEVDDSILFERSGKQFIIKGYDKVPQPKSDESIMVQYSEDILLSDIVAEFRKIYSVEIDLEVKGGIASESFGKFKTIIAKQMSDDPETTFEKFSHLPVPLKIYIAKKYYPEIFARIFDSVKEMFMEIEDIDIVEHVSGEIYLVAIQVYGKQLLQHVISNGMLKTIFYLVELYTMTNDSIVLIDEFENGLGVNCIDVLSDLMLNERTDLQYIITSHHPKIINSVDYTHWKIIDRERSTILNSDSENYGIGNSLHDAYFNLINRWEYEGKI